MDTTPEAPPQFKRKRASRACRVCKVKKVKCSGTEPCVHCIEYGERCEFEQESSRAGGLNTAELQERISALEAIVAQHTAQLALLAPKGQAARSLLPSRDASVVGTPHLGVADDMMGRTEEEVDDDLELGQFNLDPKGNPRYIGPGSTTSIFTQLNRSQRQVMPERSRGNISMPWITAQLGVQIAGSLPPLEELEWPDQDLADALVELYFRRIDPIFPVVHRPEFMRVYRTIRIAPRGDLDYSNWLAVIFAVFACASCLSDDPRVCVTGGFGTSADGGPSKHHRNGLEWNLRTGTKGTRFFAQVIVLQLHAITDATLEKLVSESLCAFYMCSVNMAVRSWMMLGKAMSMAIDMGCHRTLAHTRLSTLQQERRRKVFWSLYILDRLLASSLGRPFMIQDDDIDADLPMLMDSDDLELYCEGQISTPKGEDGPQTNLIAGFISMILLYRIAGKITQCVTTHTRANKGGGFRSMEDLRQKLQVYQVALQEWLKDDVVEHLKKDLNILTEPYRIQKVTAQASYNTISLFVNLPLLPRHGHQPTQGQVESLSKCIFACKKMISIASFVSEIVPPCHYLLDYTQHLSVAGGLLVITLLPGIVNDEEFQQQTLNEVDKCCEGLKKIGKVFSGGNAGYEMVLQMRSTISAPGPIPHPQEQYNTRPNPPHRNLEPRMAQPTALQNSYSAPESLAGPSNIRANGQSQTQYPTYLAPLASTSYSTDNLIPEFDPNLFFTGIDSLTGSVSVEPSTDWYMAFMNAVESGVGGGYQV